MLLSTLAFEYGGHAEESWFNLKSMECEMYHLRPAELEQAMDAARQLRAETLGGGTWIITAFAALLRVFRKRSPAVARRV
jgi:hypothetical protein